MEKRPGGGEAAALDLTLTSKNEPAQEARRVAASGESDWVISESVRSRFKRQSDFDGRGRPCVAVVPINTFIDCS